MYIIRRIFFVVAAILLSMHSYSQSDIAVGQWKTYFNYSSGCDVDRIDNHIFYASTSSLVRVDVQTGDINHIGKTEGLSDVGIQCSRANQSTKTVVVCYKNSNIDLYQNGKITNIPDIYNKQISGSKTINSIFTYDKYAYLACEFGVVILDLKKKSVADSWFFRQSNKDYPVKDLVIVQDGTVYAATDHALFKNNINNPNIKNMATWEQILNINTPNNTLFKQLAIFNDNLYIMKADERTVIIDSTPIVRHENTIYSYNNNVWEKDTSFTFDEQQKDDFRYMFIRSSQNRLIVACNYGIKSYFAEPAHSGLQTDNFFYYGWDYVTAIHGKDNTIYMVSPYGGLLRGSSGHTDSYNIQGPAQGAVSAMDWKNSKLVTAHNSMKRWIPNWNQGFVSSLENKTWSVVDNGYDMIDVAIAPYDNSIVFVASFVLGLFEYRDNYVYARYDNNNAPFSLLVDSSVRITSPVFDEKGNLWMGNWGSSSALVVRMRDGTWKSFTIPFEGIRYVGKIFIDSRNILWITCQTESRLVLFNHNGTPDNTADDQWAILNLSVPPEKGDFNNIHSIAEDRYSDNNKIWIGTDNGLKYYSSPSRMMENPNILPEPVYVTKDSLTELVLSSEVIRCIKIDGGNRKWIGTDNAGVFLLSPDGKYEIFHFTTENSPLLSNTILDIEIDGETGEVYFGTENGLISFRYTATDAKESYYKELKIFPNPVREDFNGYIIIEGLKGNSEVKITDAEGGMVYRTISNGGTASWDGRRFDGKKAATGVYFVFVNDETGMERKAGKILFIK